MKTTDWKFDFSSLPHWDIHDSEPWVYDEFFEIPQSDTLCCIYSIIEATMCNYIGFLAILKNKDDPKLFLNVAGGMNFSNNFSVNNKGNLIFLQPHIYNKATNTVKCPILVIDIEKSVFSYLDIENYNPNYKVVELGDGVFGIAADELQKKRDKLRSILSVLGISGDKYQKKYYERLRSFSKQKIDTKSLDWYKLDDIGLLPKMIF